MIISLSSFENQIKYILILVLLTFVVFTLAAKEEYSDPDTLAARDLITKHALLVEKGDYKEALARLEDASTIYQKSGLWKSYFHTQLMKFNFIDYLPGISKIDLINQLLQQIHLHLPGQSIELAKIWHEKGNYFLVADQLDSAVVYFNRANEIYSRIPDWTYYSFARLSIAVCFFYQNNYDSCEYHLEELQQIVKEHQISDDDLQANINNLLSIIYSVKGDLHLAIQTVLADLDRIQSKEQPTSYDSSSVANYYNSLGAWYTMKEDFNRALDYLRKSVFLYEKMGVAWEELYLINNNIAQVLAFKDNYELAIAYFSETARSILSTPQPALYSKTLKECYNGLSVCYRKSGQLETALQYARQGTEIEENFKQEIALCSQGAIYLSMGETDSAINYLLKAEEEINKTQQDQQRYIINIYNSLGEAMALKQDYPKALEYYQKALISNCSDFKDPDWKQNPGLANITRYDLLLTSLQQKAHTITQLSDENQDLEMALSTYQTCIDWIDSMRLNTVSVGSRLFWRNKVRHVYGEAIETAYQLYRQTRDIRYLDRAFSFSEKSKGILLLESRKASEGKAVGGVPDSLIQKEKDLKIDIAFYTKQLKKAEGNKEEKFIKRIREYLVSSRIALASLKEFIEKNYPGVYGGTTSGPPITTSSVQRTFLDEESVLIEYFITKEALFAFLISKDNAEFIRLTDASVLEKRIVDFSGQLLDPAAMNEDAEKALSNYDSKAFALHQLILAPLVEYFPPNTQRIHLILDGQLNNIPFEALTISKSQEASRDFAKLDFLMNHYTVSYAYSFRLLADNHLRKSILSTNQNCLAFAPRYFASDDNEAGSADELSRGGLSTLDGTSREIRGISNYYSGKFVSGKEASKSLFVELADDYGILHLATHGMADFSNPGFAHFLFSPAKEEDNDRLYHYEITNLDLTAQLAVLSACETGQGKYEEGEGVFSLARSFMQAGVPSVVMSLWKVNDLSTSELMPVFYGGLAYGLPIDKALNKARKQYLAEASLRFRHPYYWSGFVVLGDTGPLKTGRRNFLSYFLLAGLVLAFIFVLRRQLLKS